MTPRTAIGKLFTMIYLIIGLPLTLILLSDLGSIITRLIKFTSTFIYTLYYDGYYDNIKSGLDKRRRALIDKLKSSTNKTSHHRHKRRRSSNASTGTGSSNEDDDDDDEEKEQEKLGLWRSLLELGFKCVQQTNDEFDLSLGTSISFVLVYLTMGAFLFSRIAECSILNGYYSSWIALNKIGYGDLVNNRRDSDDVQFTLLLAVYALLGMAFFDLTVLSLQEKMRVLLIKNARNILVELVKFANQLGYSSWSMDSVDLENLGRNSIHKIYNKG